MAPLPESMKNWMRMGLAAASLAAFGLALVFLIQFRTAQPPAYPQVTAQQAFYGGWYYGLPVVAGDWSLMGVWLGLLALAMPNPKRLIVICMIPLNFAYLYTSQALWTNDTLGNLTFKLVVYFSPTLTTLDAECLGLFAVIVGLTYTAYRKEGRLRASMRILQVGSLTVLPLGLYIYLFLPSTLSMWVATIQERTALQWFSNMDLLFASLSLVVVTTSLLGLLKPKSVLATG
jgi:hypothetical protein